LGFLGLRLGLDDGLLWFWAGVIISYFKAQLASILPLVIELVPLIALAAARDDNGSEVNPCLADQLCPLVVVEDRHLDLIIVRRVVDGKTEFLVPGGRQ
jgi:hypothetical protein